MITLIVGKKGSGKTKKLIERATKAVETSNGNVIVIEKGLKLTYDLPHQARLIDTDAYNVSGAQMLFGFVSGICAGNYDVTDIFIDSTLKIIGQDMNVFKTFAESLNTLAQASNVKITLLVSADATDLPAGMDSLAENV